MKQIWKFVHAIIWLESQLFEEACFFDLCLVDGFVHQYVRVHGDIHMMWIFFLWRRKMICQRAMFLAWCIFQFNGFVCDKTSQDFGKVHSWARASWLQPNHENQMGVNPYFENKPLDRILSYLGLKPLFLNLKYHGVLFQCLNPQP